jgi:hypothetical protein
MFLLSPAWCAGRRAAVLLSPGATFDLAMRLREGRATLGEVFSFLSGLYFRGKLAYAEAFAPDRRGTPGALVITPTRGLMLPASPVTRALIAEFAEVDVASGSPRYLEPLARDIERLARARGRRGEVILLGSIATDKYVNLLLAAFGEALKFPVCFVGRGDMSRGAMMLRAARDAIELEYVSVQGAVRRGPRAPRVGPG